MKPIMIALGLMSGTSMDGVDVALLETDGEAFVRPGGSASLTYSGDDRALLRGALDDARAISQRDERPGRVNLAESLVTGRHIEAVISFLNGLGMTAGDVDMIGFHGQTVLHRPHDRLTVQIGNGRMLADATNIPVVFDMRAADVAAGGQGAPLVPVFHQALVRAAGLSGPVALVNMGGIGNITYIDGACDPIAFDTGPANALLDDLMLERTGVAIDRDGLCALAGTVDENVLAQLMAHQFFKAPPPKSLDRGAFSRALVAGLSTEDAAATLAAFSAMSVAAARAWLPQAPGHWIICGGGARNQAVMQLLGKYTGGCVRSADEFGWSADMMEAQAFAYLAVRSAKGLPLTFPSTTGVKTPLSGGVLALPQNTGTMI